MTITVEWGYEAHSITLTPRNWARVKSRKELFIRGKGYYYEGEFFWDYWNFTGGLEGDLIVSYGNHGDYSATGFDGKLRDADITDMIEGAETPATEEDDLSAVERKRLYFHNLLKIRFPMAPDRD
jgi:hypothetical protein